jgi:general secretion pathway protein G
VSIKSFKKQGGFTLLELLIVIVIIGILALLIIPNITSAPKKARDTKRKTDITTIRKALEEYFVNNNIYPGTTGDAATVLSGNAAGTATTGPLTTGSAPLMKAVPIDPKNTTTGGFTYVYTPANTNSTYTLTACLENDQDAGANVVTPVSPCATKTFQVINGN